MKINGVDIIQLRNIPVPKKGKESLPVPATGYSTLVQIEAKSSEGMFTGLGEIRAISSISQENPNEAFAFAEVLAKQLVNMDVDETITGVDIVKSTANLIVECTKEILGVLPTDRLPQNSHPSVRFAFDSALIDIFSQCHNTNPVSLLTGRSPVVVHRNVFGKSLKNPHSLINSMLSKQLPGGWLRSGYSKDGSSAGALLNSMAAVSKGRSPIRGIWLDLAEKWSIGDLNILTDLLEISPLMQDSTFDLVLEQPFPSYATKHYQHAIDRLESLKQQIATDVRIMLDESIWDSHSIAALQPLLPHVDLNISPQKAGSIHEMLVMVEQARAFGFSGHIYLSNAGTNTELNTIILVALAQILPGVDLFSAMPRREERIHLVYPEVQLASSDDDLRLPSGAGWATRLCQSGLKHRLKKVRFVREQDVSDQGKEALKQLLMMKAFDDITQITGDEDEVIQHESEVAEQTGQSLQLSSQDTKELSGNAT